MGSRLNVTHSYSALVAKKTGFHRQKSALLHVPFQDSIFFFFFFFLNNRLAVCACALALPPSYNRITVIYIKLQVFFFLKRESEEQQSFSPPLVRCSFVVASEAVSHL